MCPMCPRRGATTGPPAWTSSSTVFTASGTHCVPAPSRRIASARSSGIPARYGRSQTMASQASTTHHQGCGEGNLRAHQPVRIAHAVGALVMRADDMADLSEMMIGSEHRLPVKWMALDHAALGVGELTGLGQNRIRRHKLADIVEQSTEPNCSQAYTVKSDALSGSHRQLGDADHVHAGHFVLVLERCEEFVHDRGQTKLERDQRVTAQHRRKHQRQRAIPPMSPQETTDRKQHPKSVGQMRQPPAR